MSAAVPLTTMPAWSRETYGPADGVALTARPLPAPGRGEVLLRVHATALNAGDVRLLLGDPLLVRPVFGLTRPKYPVRGMDVVGTVIAIGDDASGDGIELGRRVVGEMVGGGGLASHVVAPASRLVPVPADVTSEHAATLPIAAGTAWQALDRAGIDADSASGRVPRVLVLGASGGVGTFTVQLAALRGAEVWATCGARNAGLVESLGAVRTIDHRRTPLSTLPARHFDAVIDIAGGIPLRDLQRLTSPGGSVVLATGDGGRVWGPLPRMIRSAFLSIGSSTRIRPLAATPRTEVLTKLLALTDEGRIAPVIEHVYDFADAPAALAHVEAGHTVGKVVVRAASDNPV